MTSGNADISPVIPDLYFRVYNGESTRQVFFFQTFLFFYFRGLWGMLWRMKAVKDIPNADRRLRKAPERANMHEGIADWCDCCDCEAEPRWAEVAEKMGINLSDYDDEASKHP